MRKQPFRPVTSDYHGFPYRDYPPKFRAPGGVPRRPVKGGRWEVRRTFDRTNGEHVWRAYSKGKSGHLARRFASHIEAFEWATKVVKVYEMKAGEAKDEAYFQLRVEKYGPKHVIKGHFPDRPSEIIRMNANAHRMGWMGSNA